MSDFDAGAVVAAAEGNAAPAVDTDVVVDAANPISTQGDQAPKAEPKAEEPKKPISTREALEKAAAKVKENAKTAEAKEPVKDAKSVQTASKVEAKPVASVDQTKPQAAAVDANAGGDQSTKPKYTAPERFSPDAKTAWETAPEPVKAEVHRAIRELEQGHQKYKADAEAFSEIREYHDLAKQVGTSVKDALSRYTGLERRLTSQDPNIKNQAIAEVLQYAGVTPHAYASYLAGVPANQVQQQNDQTILSLRQEVQSLKQQIGGVTSTIQEQKNTALMTDIAKFAEAHPRFDELGDSIAKLISTGMAADLDEAYQMADRLNPGTVEPKPVIPAPTQDDLKAQTLKGSKSVAGAPSAGSDPDQKGKPSSSIREALKRAQAQAG